MDASSTLLDEDDRAFKPKEDVGTVVQDPIKRTYDEAFDGDHPDKNEA